MGSMGMMNRVDDPCAYELGAKAVDFIDNFNPRGWLRKGGVRMSMARGKLPRYQGPKPRYAINYAHVPGCPDFNRKKTPLPGDAEEVYRRAVPADDKNRGPWFGRNAEGSIDRYSDGNNGTAHFSGIDGVGQGIQNLTKYARQRLKEL